MYHVDSSSPLRRSVFLESLSPASLPQSFRCILLLTKNFTSMRGIGHHRTNNLLLYLKEFAEIWK